ncbi:MULTISPECIES: hypothetical protein [unclassified Halomonas]|uniref:hypothetical protein n=1 Tax=unclassified Halomonas TaxID=2609666 RepID=UPI001C970E27|nr:MULTISPECIES: hypothetical protein [unclassified Halomonas]MBY5925865.1 hypothetical protein [Halomonas sp. DP4Y7-2]MBY6232907.1 hypothetical protein [Halomonas sp. DP4Y7-1]
MERFILPIQVITTLGIIGEYMLCIGKEEPTINNHSLYEYNNILGKIELDRSQHRRLNRYTFVRKKGRATPVSEIVLLAASCLDLNFYASSAWLKHLPSRSVVASKLLEKKYKKMRWEVSVENEVYHATFFKSSDSLLDFSFLDECSEKSGLVFFFSKKTDFSPKKIVNSDRAWHLASKKRFIPDAEILDTLCKNDFSLAYLITDNLGNTGVVVVGNAKLNFSRLREKEISIFEGINSYKAITTRS